MKEGMSYMLMLNMDIQPREIREIVDINLPILIQQQSVYNDLKDLVARNPQLHYHFWACSIPCPITWLCLFCGCARCMISVGYRLSMLIWIWLAQQQQRCTANFHFFLSLSGPTQTQRLGGTNTDCSCDSFYFTNKDARALFRAFEIHYFRMRYKLWNCLSKWNEFLQADTVQHPWRHSPKDLKPPTVRCSTQILDYRWVPL